MAAVTGGRVQGFNQVSRHQGTAQGGQYSSAEWWSHLYFSQVRGISIGRSLVEESMVETAKGALGRGQEAHC
jgi:hypothetical protein